jgi:hypothetical protein
MRGQDAFLLLRGWRISLFVKDMSDDYKDKLEEAGYFGDDSQNL